MKNKLFIILIVLLMTPVFVFADSGMPSRPEMKAKIVNTEGAIIYLYNDGKYTPSSNKLAFDSIITISDEYEKYAVTYDKKTEQNNYISLKDIKYLWDINNYNLVDAGLAFMVDDTTIYDNPSMSGQELGTIEKGTTINIKEAYYKNEEYNAFYEWAYVEYNDIKGWIYISSNDVFNYWDGDQSKHGTVAPNTNDKIMIVDNNTSLYGDVFKLNNIGYLNKNEEYIPKYYYYNRTTEKAYYYIETSKGSGWVHFEDLGIRDSEMNNILIVDNQIKVYDLPKKYYKTSSLDVKVGSTYKVLYTYYSENNYFYVKIDDTYYWISNQDNGIKTYWGTTEYELTKNVNYYSKANNSKDNLLGYLTPGKYDCIYIRYIPNNNEYVYYVIDKGFIFTEDEYDPSKFYNLTKHKIKFLTDIITYSDENLEIEKSYFIANREYEIEVAFVRKDKNYENVYYADDFGYFVLGMDISDLEVVDNTKNLTNDKNNALYYIIGSVVLSLAVLGSIILIIKNKKNKAKSITNDLETKTDEQKSIESEKIPKEEPNQNNDKTI